MSNWVGRTDGTFRSWFAGVAGNEPETRKYAEEIVALAPDVILATGQAAELMLKATRTIPVVFAVVPDPMGSGFVQSLSRPGGNATGFMQFEYSLSGKWLELLKEIAPNVTHAAVLRDPTFVSGIGQVAVIQAVAPSVGIEVSPIDLREPNQIERAIATFAQSPNGGLILAASGDRCDQRQFGHCSGRALQGASGIQSTDFCCCRRVNLLRAEFY